MAAARSLRRWASQPGSGVQVADGGVGVAEGAKLAVRLGARAGAVAVAVSVGARAMAGVSCAGMS